MLCGSLDGRRGGFGGEWIHLYVWLRCPSEIITTLSIDYTQYKIKSLKIRSKRHEVQKGRKTMS